MSKIIKMLALLCSLVPVLNGFADQKSLDADRSGKLEAVFESLKKSDAEALASTLPGLQEKEALAVIQRNSIHWGDLTKLSTTKERLAEPSDKGSMEIVVHWGSGTTSSGRWMELRSREFPNWQMRIGLLFPTGSSDAKQFLAVEWNCESKPAERGEHQVGEAARPLKSGPEGEGGN